MLNSAATLFSLDVFKKFIKPDATTRQLVWSGQLCSFFVAVFAVVAAPLFFHGREHIFGFFQKLNGVYFIPLLTILLVGMFNRRVDGRSALITLVIGVMAMVIGTFFPGTWLTRYFHSGYHYMGLVFVLLVGLQLGLGRLGLSRAEDYQQTDAQAVDLTPWKPAPWIGAGLVCWVLGIYLFFAQG